MDTDLVLNVAVREKTGTGPARASRREGMVPGVLYGGAQGPVAIALKLNEVVRGINRGGFISKLVQIDHNGTRQPALVKDIQFDVVSSAPTHIDLLRVVSDQEVTVDVTVEFINEEKSPGLKRGGALNVVRPRVEMSCLPDRIPSHITADLEGLEIGDSIHISAITLPEGVAPTITDRDFTIATITGKGAKADTEDGAGDGEEGDGEGEAEG